MEHVLIEKRSTHGFCWSGLALLFCVFLYWFLFVLICMFSVDFLATSIHSTFRHPTTLIGNTIRFCMYRRYRVCIWGVSFLSRYRFFFPPFHSFLHVLFRTWTWLWKFIRYFVLFAIDYTLATSIRKLHPLVFICFNFLASLFLRFSFIILY